MALAGFLARGSLLQFDLPGFPVVIFANCSYPLTVAGAATDQVPYWSTLPCSHLIPGHVCREPMLGEQ
jgi:hypothetical protein